MNRRILAMLLAGMAVLVMGVGHITRAENGRVLQTLMPVQTSAICFEATDNTADSDASTARKAVADGGGSENRTGADSTSERAALNVARLCGVEQNISQPKLDRRTAVDQAGSFRMRRAGQVRAVAADDDQWEYTINEATKTATINKYTGNETVVSVPEKIAHNDDEYAVNSIGADAFRNCTSLTEITIPDEVTSIGYQAFDGCTALRSVVIPNGVSTIGSSTFSGCGALTSVTIPDSVTSIASSAFSRCSSLTSITVPDGVTSIGRQAFSSCYSLTSINIPHGVTSIEEDTFSNCSALTSISIPNGVINIEDSAFDQCYELASVTIPDSVTSIGNRAFCWCKSLSSITLPSQLTSFGGWAFAECKSLTSINIPSSVTKISSQAFDGCDSLMSITIQDGPTWIGDRTFAGCTSLTSITIPSSVQNVYNTAFNECSALQNIVYSGASTQWKKLSVTVPSDAALVWCASDDVILGNIAQRLTIGSSLADTDTKNLFSDEQLTVTVEFIGGIPSRAQVPIYIDFEGLTIIDSSRNTVSTDLTADEPAHAYTCTVTAEAGDSVQARIISAGGMNVDVVWNGSVAENAPTVTVSCAEEGPILVGQNIDLTVSTERVLTGGLSGTINLTGLKTNTGSAAPTFMLAAGSLTQTISCTVDKDVKEAKAWLSSLRAGQHVLTPDSSVLEWTVLSPTVRIACSPGTSVTADENVAVTVTGQDIPMQGLSGTLALNGLRLQTRSTEAPFRLTAVQPSQTLTCVAETGVTKAEIWVSELRSGNYELTPTTERITLSVFTETATVTPGASAPSAAAPSGSPQASPTAAQSSGTQNAGTDSPGLSTLPSVIPPTASDTPSATPGSAPSETAGAASHAPVSSAEPSSTPQPNPVELRPQLPADAPSGLEVVSDADTSTGSALVGSDIGSLWQETTAGTLTSWIEDSESGSTVRVVTSEGEPVALDEQIATGMIVEVRSTAGELLQESTIVVKGDVTGSGEIDLTQLVRMARAVVGTEPLEGAFALAGDLNDDGETTLTDLVKLAQMYSAGSLDVDYVVADEDLSEVLQEAGYDMDAWAEDMAVLRAGIPDDVDITSIAWTQHDIFEDGREQKLYYEGSEEDLVFGTYDEGRTIITTQVTTKAGKVGTRQTSIDWGTEKVEEPPGAGLSAEPAASPAPRSMTTTVSAVDMSSTARPGATRPRPTTRPSAAAQPTASAAATGTRPPSRPTTRPSADSSQPAAASTASATPTATPTPSFNVPASALLFAFRAQALGANNDLREAMKVRPLLRRSNDLSKAAMVRAEEMAAAGVLQHQRPDGSKYDTVVTLGEGTVVGENIHFNKGYPTADVAKIAEQGWENSAPHRKQMLEPRYLYTGLGFAQAPDGAWYCVQLFSNGDNVLSIDTPKI